jgi:hypothetical protein
MQNCEPSGAWKFLSSKGCIFYYQYDICCA